MEITPIPLPNIISTHMLGDASKVAAVAQAQAMAPVGARAVDPSGSGKGGRKTLSNEQRSKGGEKAQSGRRGDKVNIDA